MNEYSEYIVLGIALVIGVISWMLRKEHARIEALEADHVDMNARLARAIEAQAVNSVEDKGWRKHVEANHKNLQKADEDRRNDTRKIYDKIEITQEKIQRLAEMIAGKK